MKVMPKNIKVYNASNEPCDMLVGPCCCGAWHQPEEILGKIEKLNPTPEKQEKVNE